MKSRVQTQYIVDLYTKDHLTMQEIGDKIGMTRQGIYKRLKTMGVKAKQSTLISLSCPTCNRPFVVNRARYHQAKRHFCSQDCYNQYYTSPNSIINRNGQRIARILVRQYYNVQTGHIVHHVDGNDKNNSIDNLWLFTNQSDHMKHHRGGDSKPLWKGSDYD